jgi:NAD(P)-dependent dehydrogenase (short-subunit alcohol dehydrogenase family)
VPTLVVFGARNLGRVVARELAGEGWDVAAVARTDETLDALRAEVPDALGVRADAALAADVQRVFEEARGRFGRVDLVVNAITDWPRGGSILELEPDALEPYVQTLVPAIFNVLRIGARELADVGAGTLVQVTGGSARRGMPGRGPWAAAAFATRALVQSAAADVRERGVHIALLIVDAVIESDKTAQWLEGEPPEKSASMEDVARAIRYLHEQSPRAWTHELQLTPARERWVP